MQLRLPALVLIAGLLAVFALVAACGGDDGGGDSNGNGGDGTNGISSPNLEEYFETIEAAAITFETQRNAVEAAAEAALIAATSEEERITARSEFAAEAATIYDDFVNELNNYYVVLLISPREGWVFSKSEVIANIRSEKWRLREADNNYKINPPLPNVSAFAGKARFYEKLGISEP